MNHTIPQLLSPAGDWDSLRAAVANGADAVYFGLENYNARHRAQNFTSEELPQIMKYLHDHNVRGYLTFNTLIFSDELTEAEQYIRRIAQAGVDAVIVQDLGLLRLIHAMAPQLELHGSTQMTLTEPAGIEFVRELGVSRVVMARELSLEHIKAIKAQTPVELEVFIHGALCVAYSGQCLTSESLGGRSANRGQCAQACRLPYDMMVDGQFRDFGDKAYLLSPQDLAAYDLVGDLAKIGVSCLKIEGRLKGAHYVAATTQTYRAALDAAREQHAYAIPPQQRVDLEQTFSRGFSHGFLDGVNHQKLVTARFPKSRGVQVGSVVRVTDASILVNPTGKASLKPGDGVVFDEGHPEQDEQGGRVFVVQPRGKYVEIELGRGDVNLRAISPGALVWKTDDPQLRKRLEHSFSRDTVVNRRPIDAHVIAKRGQNLTVTFQLGEIVASASGETPLAPASKFPATEPMIREQLSRLGDTPFELGRLICEIAGEPMVPKSMLNDLRRQAIAEIIEQQKTTMVVREGELESMRQTIFGDTDKNVCATNSLPDASLHVLVRNLDQLDAVIALPAGERPAMVYCDFEDVRRYAPAVERARAAELKIALATLRIVKPGEEGFLRQVSDQNPDALLVRNLAAIALYQRIAPQIRLIGDYSLNVANELTADLFMQKGLLRVVPSYDLNWSQMNAMLARSPRQWYEIVIHQHMPMFHMEHCVFAHMLSSGKDFHDCGRVCEKHTVDLRDRKGESHPLIPDVGCRNTVYNAQAQSGVEYLPQMLQLGIRHFRIELLREKPEEIAPLLERYRKVLAGEEEPGRSMMSLRVIQQLGVTRGTLARE